jgi:hypothetical protein
MVPPALKDLFSNVPAARASIGTTASNSSNGMPSQAGGTSYMPCKQDTQKVKDEEERERKRERGSKDDTTLYRPKTLQICECDE